MAVVKTFDGTTIHELGSTQDLDAIHDNVAAEISAVTEKVTPTATDLLLIEDAAASNQKRRIQVGSLPTAVPSGDPNTKRKSQSFTASQTAQNFGDAPAAGKKLAVTEYAVTLSADSDKTSVNFVILVGTTEIGGHAGIAPGDGIVEGDASAVLHTGAADERIKVTHDSPQTSTGTIRISASYHEVD